jgi:hypothetical protein
MYPGRSREQLRKATEVQNGLYAPARIKRSPEGRKDMVNFSEMLIEIIVVKALTLTSLECKLTSPSYSE